METDREIYPMPLFCQLAVTDLDASTRWYEALGFDVVYSMPVMAHVRYRKYADVMLVADEAKLGDRPPGVARRGTGVSIHVGVETESVDDVANRATEYGADVVEGPYETPWNTRELVVSDLDGYELVFSEPVDTERSFEEVIGASERGTSEE
ncbi:VOC family protein [Haloprofundus halophilus]|uniref:VOC family protein n=1 Tax=Haloprofundus halophilus TaxID=2283527 RepID=UPI0018E57590|nr:VOC family protein [Haloprofundus halophilus]